MLSLSRHIRNHSVNEFNNLFDGTSLIGKFSEKLIENGNNSFPSGLFVGKILLGLGEIEFSLGSESFGVSDILNALFQGGGVVFDSDSGVVNSGLRDVHEFGEGFSLFGFFLLGVGDSGNEGGSDVLEFFDNSLEDLGVGEVGEFEESLDDRRVLGLLEGGTELGEGFLDLGHLDEGGAGGTEIGEEVEALIDGGDGGGGVLDVGLVVGLVGGSLFVGGVHLGQGLSDQGVVSLDGSFELGLQWVELVVKFGGRRSDVVFGMGDLVFETFDPTVVLVFLPFEILGVEVGLEFVVLGEVFEGLDELSGWGADGQLKIEE